MVARSARCRVQSVNVYTLKCRPGLIATDEGNKSDLLPRWVGGEYEKDSIAVQLSDAPSVAGYVIARCWLMMGEWNRLYLIFGSLKI